MNTPRRRIFVSFHHDDQKWKDHFVAEFAVRFNVFTDGSLDEEVDSLQPDYVHRQIREEYITGTSATVVLCGNETWKRRYVDWEIHSTLMKRHGLFGIVIPGTTSVGINTYRVPDRLHDNVPGYAILYDWPTTFLDLQSNIEESIRRAERTVPSNAREQMANNKY